MIVESGKFQDLQGESASWRPQRVNVQFQSKGQPTWDTGKASVFLLAQREKKKTWLQLWTGFPDSSVGKEFTCNAGDTGLIPGSGRSTGEGMGYPLQYSWASLAPQLVKNLPAMRETWVQSLGWEDPLEKESLPTPVFWPGDFHGLYSPWGRKELDTIEWLSVSFFSFKHGQAGRIISYSWKSEPTQAFKWLDNDDSTLQRGMGLHSLYQFKY